MSTARSRLALGVIALVAVTVVARAAGQDAPSAQKAPTVLFLSPRGAAKSVLASAYFQYLAGQRGLDVRAESAGTEPADTVATDVAAHLTRNGCAVPAARPRKATAQDLASADVVDSIGCDLGGCRSPGADSCDGMTSAR